MSARARVRACVRACVRARAGAVIIHVRVLLCACARVWQKKEMPEVSSSNFNERREHQSLCSPGNCGLNSS